MMMIHDKAGEQCKYTGGETVLAQIVKKIHIPNWPGIDWDYETLGLIA